MEEECGYRSRISDLKFPGESCFFFLFFLSIFDFSKECRTCFNAILRIYKVIRLFYHFTYTTFLVVYNVYKAKFSVLESLLKLFTCLLRKRVFICAYTREERIDNKIEKEKKNICWWYRFKWINCKVPAADKYM